jgi:hypothetical protein
MSNAAPSTSPEDRSCAHDYLQSSLPWPAQRVPRSFRRGPVVTGGERDVPEEVAVAFTYNGSARRHDGVAVQFGGFCGRLQHD